MSDRSWTPVLHVGGSEPRTAGGYGSACSDRCQRDFDRLEKSVKELEATVAAMRLELGTFLKSLHDKCYIWLPPEGEAFEWDGNLWSHDPTAEEGHERSSAAAAAAVAEAEQ